MSLIAKTALQLPYVSVPSYDPDDPYYIVGPGTLFDGVVNITDGMYTGSGVLLQTGRHILTAAHVVEDMPAYTIDVNADLVGGRQTYAVSSVTLHPNWTSNWGYDLAILELTTPMPVAGFKLYEGSNEIGQVATLVGYGVQAIGSAGVIEPDYELGETKRRGENRWEAYNDDIEQAGFDPLGNAPDESLLFSDFDNGLSANDALGYYLGIHDLGLGRHEVASTGGDSGGPRFLEVNGEWQIAGIVNGGFTSPAPVDYTDGLDASYGELSFDTRVSYFSDWINSVTGLSGAISDDFSPDGTGTNGRINVGGLQTGQLETTGDRDWFRVSLNAGQQYRFELEGDFDTVFRLYNASGALLAEDDDSGDGLDSLMHYTPSSSGTYYAVASSFSDSSTGSYTLSLSTVNTNNPGTPATPSLDDYFVVQRGIISRGAGDDTYIIANPTVDPLASITLTDNQGNDVIQLIDGLELTGSMVASDALRLQLSNGAEITVLGASDFTYEVGGNPLADDQGSLLSYDQLVTNTLGIASGVPATGLATGGSVIIGGGIFTNVIDLMEGSSGTVATTTNDDLVTLDVAAARTLTANTQITLTGFDTSADQLQFNLDALHTTTTLAGIDGVDGVWVEYDPFANNTLVTFGTDTDGDVIALTLAGVSDTNFVTVNVV